MTAWQYARLRPCTRPSGSCASHKSAIMYSRRCKPGVRRTDWIYPPGASGALFAAVTVTSLRCVIQAALNCLAHEALGSSQSQCRARSPDSHDRGTGRDGNHRVSAGGGGGGVIGMCNDEGSRGREAEACLARCTAPYPGAPHPVAAVAARPLDCSQAWQGRAQLTWMAG